MQTPARKKILMIVASNGYRDEELDVPRKFFRSKGIDVAVASSSTIEARGMLGGSVKPSIALRDVRVNNYDAIIFVGGTGSSEYWNDPTAHKIVKDTLAQGKVIAAICIAPVTLALSGILKGKKATVFPSEIETIKSKGAVYSGQDVEMDSNIITADGPKSAKKFAETIVTKLQ